MAERDCSSVGNIRGQNIYFDLFLFWRKKAEQRCLRDCLADLALTHFMTCQSLGVIPLPGSGDVLAKGKVAPCSPQIVGQCPFLSFQHYLPKPSSDSWASNIQRTGIRRTQHILCVVAEPSTYTVLQTIMHSYICTHIYILNTLPLNNREKQMVDNNNGSSSPTKACNYYNYTILD